MKKIIVTAIALVCVASVVMAGIIPFKLNPLVENSTIDGVSAATYVAIYANPDGDDLVYSMQYSAVDLDGGPYGTLSWDVRFQMFNGASLNNGEISVGPTKLPASADGTDGFTSSSGWMNSTIRFSIENIFFSADPGYTASFNGFDGLWLTEGTYYVGEGAGTTELINSADSNVSFSPQDTLNITAWMEAEGNRDLTGSFTVIPEPSTFSLIGVAAGVMILVRRRRLKI